MIFRQIDDVGYADRYTGGRYHLNDDMNHDAMYDQSKCPRLDLPTHITHGSCELTIVSIAILQGKARVRV